MDEVDVAIVREMVSPHSFQWDIRKSYASLAKKAGVDEDTVRARFRRFQDDGVLQNWELVVNPSALGLRMARAEVDVGGASAKERIVPGLALVDGVRWIISYYGNLLLVTFYYRNEKELERRIRLISSISGAVLSWYDVPFPRCDIRLSRTDWSLVKSLRKDPRKNYSAIARELNISVRTARRRIKRMIDARSFFLETVLNLKRMKGGVLCYLRVLPAEGRRGDELQRAVFSKVDKVGASRTILAHSDPPVQVFVIYCDSVGEVSGILKRVRAIESVKEARADVLEERLSIHEWLDEQIEEKLREAPKSGIALTAPR